MSLRQLEMDWEGFLRAADEEAREALIRQGVRTRDEVMRLAHWAALFSGARPLPGAEDPQVLETIRDEIRNPSKWPADIGIWYYRRREDAVAQTYPGAMIWYAAHAEDPNMVDSLAKLSDAVWPDWRRAEAGIWVGERQPGSHYLLLVNGNTARAKAAWVRAYLETTSAVESVSERNRRRLEDLRRTLTRDDLPELRRRIWEMCQTPEQRSSAIQRLKYAARNQVADTAPAP